jgi:alpha-1,6-mannosyltransferase
MRIVDVSAFYAPQGGGVRTYVEAKLKAGPRFGHEMIVVIPGERDEVIERAPGAILASLASPKLPVDRRYRYFDDEKALHRLLDAWRPDHVEASSPWSSATMVGRWQGSATRSLVMHSDPLAAYAYRWLGAVASIATIDRWFGWFWNHLRSLGHAFDTVICANCQFTRRLREGGIRGAETVPMGVEPGLFSPTLRSRELRSAALASLGLEPGSTLLLGLGRFSAEKRWDMVIRAAGAAALHKPIGLLVVGDGAVRRKIEATARRFPTVAVMPHLGDRSELARLLASADALVHGCEAETFCLVAAEARASGIPLIVPDRGAAADQRVQGVGAVYDSGSSRSLERAIGEFIDRGPEFQRAAATRASDVRSMDDHFAQLFDRYERLAPSAVAAAAVRGSARFVAEPIPNRALAASGTALIAPFEVRR